MALSVARLLCPSNPTWEMLQSKNLLREASHGLSHEGERGRGRGRGLVPISSVLCRVEAWRGLAAFGERGVVHRASMRLFRCAGSSSWVPSAGPLAKAGPDHTASGRPAGYLSTQVLTVDVHGDMG